MTDAANNCVVSHLALYEETSSYTIYINDATVDGAYGCDLTDIKTMCLESRAGLTLRLRRKVRSLN